MVPLAVDVAVQLDTAEENYKEILLGSSIKEAVRGMELRL
jgi:hypothetical protein